jgi:hypothetical protein
MKRLVRRILSHLAEIIPLMWVVVIILLFYIAGK